MQRQILTYMGAYNDQNPKAQRTFIQESNENSDKQLDSCGGILKKHIILLGNRFSQNIFRSLKVANSSSMELSIVQSVA